MVVRVLVIRAGLNLRPRKILVLVSVTGYVDPRAIVRLEGLYPRGQSGRAMKLTTPPPSEFSA
jgi:hypothetical protein